MIKLSDSEKNFAKSLFRTMVKTINGHLAQNGYYGDDDCYFVRVTMKEEEKTAVVGDYIRLPNETGIYYIMSCDWISRYMKTMEYFVKEVK